ncbi:hypothetical protein LTR16_000085 [Cryomyces antarcticus]|uniref:DUF7729 domain-containing protein n=1 Tax=Cryomyces antarcticus TaxID=329879 RepID=A0ABR0LRC2_9PEZI|nr:hypothetical protein LTR60_002315 [Cryomyces antarcticus]KAK5018178.1 hypothetical protein LTR39_001132 [Cryomyces antarcticus]KAK5202192.1 hypothetical protein LTR16_000085 [Cryomyces antarcticus]
MASLARDIQSGDHCGSDFAAQNPTVVQAYNGFVAYQPLYHAGCLKNTAGDYCFASAITNTSSTTDSYTYYLPLGVPLPGGSRPTCNTCLQNTMAIFSNAASNSSQPVSHDYGDAAQQINLGCGPNFVNVTVPRLASAAMATGASMLGFGGWGLLTLLAVLLSSFLS